MSQENQQVNQQEPNQNKDYGKFVEQLKQIVGDANCITDSKLNERFRKGIRYGGGDALAVVRPSRLAQYYRVAKLCYEYDVIMISQAANTGLTGGSTPFGDYDRPVIVVNTLKMDQFTFINNNTQVLASAGATLFRLEEELGKIGREPHSVIGSSCIGASVIGGICNNSGGALVQRGPAFTEYSCYARINEDGEFEFHNNLGLKFEEGLTPEQILDLIQDGAVNKFSIDETVQKRASSTDYKDKVVLVDEDSPARYNADPERLKESSGSAGHLVVFAVRLDSFEKPKVNQVYIISSNDINVLTDVRRASLTEMKNGLPISGEYIHRDAYNIGKIYGKDTTFFLDKIGTKYLPKLYALKAWYDRIFSKFLPSSDRFLQAFSKLLPNLLPESFEKANEKYEHHLILNVGGQELIDETTAWLEKYFAEYQDSQFIKCNNREAKIAMLHRFSIAGAAIRYRECHSKEIDICAIDVALRRNDRDWFEKLPKEIDDKILVKLYYGHFLCHVFHQDYLVKLPHKALEVEEEILATLYARGAEYPAEHNVGHLYHAKETLEKHYKDCDPTNSFNPGVGKLAKYKFWAKEKSHSCGCGCQYGDRQGH